MSILLAWIVLNFALVEWVLSPEGRREQEEEKDSVDQHIGGGIPAASSSSAALVKQRNARKTSSFVQKQSKPKNRPPLDAILSKDDGKVIGDPGFLLDVAVIGFGKCGTSTIMDWMGQHREVRAFPKEVWNLMDRQLPTFIQRLYTELEAGPFLYGYKAPQDITQDYILDYYRKYWPHAKLIIGSECVSYYVFMCGLVLRSISNLSLLTHATLVSLLTTRTRCLHHPKQPSPPSGSLVSVVLQFPHPDRNEGEHRLIPGSGTIDWQSTLQPRNQRQSTHLHQQGRFCL